MNVIARRSKSALASGIACIVLSALLIVLSVVLTLVVILSGESDFSVCILCVVLALIFGAILVLDSVIVAKIVRLPKVLIERDGDTLKIYQKDGILEVDGGAVLRAEPVKSFWTASLIGLASNHYDSSIRITLLDGRTPEVPYVSVSPQVCNALFAIGNEVRSKRLAQTAAEEASPEESSPAAPPDAPEQE